MRWPKLNLSILLPTIYVSLRYVPFLSIEDLAKRNTTPYRKDSEIHGVCTHDPTSPIILNFVLNNIYFCQTSTNARQANASVMRMQDVLMLNQGINVSVIQDTSCMSEENAKVGWGIIFCFLK